MLARSVQRPAPYCRDEGPKQWPARILPFNGPDRPAYLVSAPNGGRDRADEPEETISHVRNVVNGPRREVLVNHFVCALSARAHSRHSAASQRGDLVFASVRRPALPDAWSLSARGQRGTSAVIPMNARLLNEKKSRPSRAHLGMTGASEPRTGQPRWCNEDGCHDVS